MSNIKRVIFDLDNTLIDTEEVKRLFRQIAEQYNKGGDFDRLYDLARTDESGKIIKITLDSFLSTLEQYLDGGMVDREMAKKFFVEACADDRLLLPGTRELLKFCQKQGMEVYLISLGVQSWQDKKIEISGLDEYFSKDGSGGKGKIIFTEDIGAGKKDILHQEFGEEFDGAETILFNDKPIESEALLKDFSEMELCLREEPRDKRYQIVREWQLSLERLKGSERVKVSNDLGELRLLFIEKYFPEIYRERYDAENK